MWYYQLHCGHTMTSQGPPPNSDMVVFCKECRRYQAYVSVVGTGEEERPIWEEDTDEYDPEDIRS